MKIKYQSPERLKKEILSILFQRLDADKYKVFFFGSRVYGKSREGSDIDIGIEGPPIPPKALLEIEEEIENLPTLYKIDIVDFSRVAPKFKEVAKEHIELLK